MFRTLGHQTDALVMAGRSIYEDRGEYLIQRTPGEPDFWYGNCLIYRHMRSEAEMRQAFRQAHPMADHFVVQFDFPSWDRSWADSLGGDLEVEHADTLSATRPVSGPVLPSGISMRVITEAADWSKVTALQHEIGVEQGFTQDSHRAYIETKFSRIKAATQLGQAAWFGAFDRDVLVADLGVFWEGTLARYQGVETRVSHRSRGICAALLAEAYRHVQARTKATQFVIVAEEEGPKRLYQRAGFAPVEKLMSLSRAGY